MAGTFETPEFELYKVQFNAETGKNYKDDLANYIQYVQAKTMEKILKELEKLTKK